MNYEEITECRLCKNNNLIKYLELEDIHLVNKFYKYQTVAEKFPLAVNFCPNCSNSQLTIKVKPELMFDEYTYFSSVSSTFKDHCKELATTVIKNYYPGQLIHVLDIASNDGCLLKQFNDIFGIDVLGVDPARNVANEAILDGIPTVVDYWGDRVAKQIKEKYAGGIHVITAQNVLAHVDDQRDFMKGVSTLLAPGGVFVVEFPHSLNMLKHHQFDTIYHEHGCYLSLTAVCGLAEEFGLTLHDASEQPTHGGSLRLFFRHTTENHKIQKNAIEVWKKERDSGIQDKAFYKDYQKQVNDIINKEKEKLYRLHNADKRGVLFGASAKGTVLLNNLGTAASFFDYIIDETSEKQGKIMPNLKYRVIGLDHPDHFQYDYVYATPWNFKKEIKQKLQNHNTNIVFPFEE